LSRTLPVDWEHLLRPRLATGVAETYLGPPPRKWKKPETAAVVAELASRVACGEWQPPTETDLVDRLVTMGALGAEAISQMEAQQQYSMIQTWEWIPHNRSPSGYRRERRAEVKGTIRRLVQRLVNLPQETYETEVRGKRIQYRQTMARVFSTLATISEEAEGTIAQRQIWPPSPYLLIHRIDTLPAILTGDLPLLRLQRVRVVEDEAGHRLEPVEKCQREFSVPKLQFRGRLPLDLVGPPSLSAFHRAYPELVDTQASEVLQQILRAVAREHLDNGEPQFWVVLDHSSRILGTTDLEGEDT